MHALNYSRRWGRLKVPGFLIRELRQGGVDSGAFKQLIKLFSEVLVLRADHNMATDGIEYMGISHRFDPLEEGDVIPEYEVLYQQNHYTPKETDDFWCQSCHIGFCEKNGTPGFCPQCKSPGISPDGSGYFEYKIIGFRRVDDDC